MRAVDTVWRMRRSGPMHISASGLLLAAGASWLYYVSLLPDLPDGGTVVSQVCYNAPVVLTSVVLVYLLVDHTTSSAVRHMSAVLLISNGVFMGTTFFPIPDIIATSPLLFSVYACWYALDLCLLVALIPITQIPRTFLLRNAANVVVIMSIIEVVFNIVLPWTFPSYSESFFGRAAQFRLDTTIAVAWGYMSIGRFLRGWSGQAQAAFICGLGALIGMDMLMTFSLMSMPSIALMQSWNNPFIFRVLLCVCFTVGLYSMRQHTLTWQGPAALSITDTLRQSFVRSGIVVGFLGILIVLNPVQGHTIWFVIALIGRELLSRYERELYVRQQQQLQTTLVEKNTALTTAGEQILYLLTSRMRLVDHAAHDLGHALVTQQAAIDFALYDIEQQGIAHDAVDHHRTQLEASVQFQKTLLDEIREMARIEQNIALVLEYQEIAFDSLAHQVLQRLEPQFLQREYSLTLIAPPANYVVQCDAARMGRVLHNLCVNALRALRTNGSVIVSLAVEADILTCQVQDNGIGIDPVELAILQQTQYRGTTGIGLQFCESVIRQHHGTLRLQSEAQRGTTVTLTLPCKKPI